MADRKAELERKKAKLMALREEKERRKREKEQKEVGVSALTFLVGFLHNHNIIGFKCYRGLKVS